MTTFRLPFLFLFLFSLESFGSSSGARNDLSCFEGLRRLAQQAWSQIQLNDPEKFDPKADWQFVVHSLAQQSSSYPLLPYVHPSYFGPEVDLVTHPSLIDKKQFVSSSLINQSHPITKYQANLTLGITPGHIVAAGPDDLMSDPSWLPYLPPDAIEPTIVRNFRRGGIAPPDKMYAESGYNEVLLHVDDPVGGPVRVNGFLIMTDFKGRPLIGEEQFNAFKASATANHLPLNLVQRPTGVNWGGWVSLDGTPPPEWSDKPVTYDPAKGTITHNSNGISHRLTLYLNPQTPNWEDGGVLSAAGIKWSYTAMLMDCKAPTRERFLTMIHEARGAAATNGKLKEALAQAGLLTGEPLQILDHANRKALEHGVPLRKAWAEGPMKGFWLPKLQKAYNPEK